MKKSPFSTPRGGGGYGNRNKYSPKFHSPYENKNYFHQSNSSFNTSSPKFNRESGGSDDFIPFDTSSPSFNDRRQSGQQFFRSRGRRNNFVNSFSSPGSYNDSGVSPKMFIDTSPSNYNRTPRGRRNTSFNKNPFDKVPLSEFVNLKEVLEDPWKELEDLNNSTRKSEAASVDDSMRTGCSSDLDNITLNESILEQTSKCFQDAEETKCSNTKSDLSICATFETSSILDNKPSTSDND